VDVEDNEALHKQDEFESVYNFRFQESGSAHLPTYQRNPTDSVRRPDERRKLKRQKRMENKSREAKQKEDEKKTSYEIKKSSNL